MYEKMQPSLPQAEKKIVIRSQGGSNSKKMLFMPTKHYKLQGIRKKRKKNLIYGPRDLVVNVSWAFLIIQCVPLSNCHPPPSIVLGSVNHGCGVAIVLSVTPPRICKRDGMAACLSYQTSSKKDCISIENKLRKKGITPRLEMSHCDVAASRRRRWWCSLSFRTRRQL